MIDKNMPCGKDCSKRHSRCHIECLAYISWHEDRVKQLSKQYKKGNLERDLISYEVSRVERLKKRNGR